MNLPGALPAYRGHPPRQLYECNHIQASPESSSYNDIVAVAIIVVAFVLVVVVFLGDAYFIFLFRTDARFQLAKLCEIQLTQASRKVMLNYVNTYFMQYCL